MARRSPPSRPTTRPNCCCASSTISASPACARLPARRTAAWWRSRSASVIPTASRASSSSAPRIARIRWPAPGAWCSGASCKFAIESGKPAQGLELARALAMATYRSPEEFAARFAGAPRAQRATTSFVLPVEEYLFARGAEYAQRYRPDSFVCLSESIDLHRVDAARIFAPVTAIAVREDQLVPLGDMRAMVARLPNAELHEISSVYGHDAFLKENRRLAPIFANVLNDSRNRPDDDTLTQDTRAVRAGLENCDVTGAVVPPLHLSSTYAFRGFGDKRKYDYSRSGNPTRDLLAEALADLEGGAGAVITGSGMGAITLVGHLLPVGARVVAPHDCYGGTFRLFTAWKKRGELAGGVRRLRQCRGGRARRCRSPRRWCGSKRPAIRCCASPISPTSRKRAHAIGALVVGGQHLPVAGLAAADRARRGHRGAFDHQVHQRPQRRGRRRGHRAKKELAEQLAWWGNCLGLTGSRLRQLSHAARPAHAARAAARARQECPGGGGIPREAEDREARVLPGPCRRIPGTTSPSASSPASAPSSRSKWQGGVDGAKRFSRSARVVLAGGVAGRRREPRRASGHDDSCRDGARSARRGGTGRWAAAAVDRHRVHRRPAARPGRAASTALG